MAKNTSSLSPNIAAFSRKVDQKVWQHGKAQAAICNITITKWIERAMIEKLDRDEHCLTLKNDTKQ